MKLPAIDTYAFPVTIPSTGKTLALRPFLVREEKLLLMAQEADNPDEQIEAIAQVIRNCTNGVIEPTEVPYFDIEYLLLQLRTRSVGEVVSPIYECNQTIAETQQECKHRTEVKINLNDVQLTDVERPDTFFKIALNSRYTLFLRYPTVFTINKLLLATTRRDALLSGKGFDALCDVFDKLYDAETDTTYNFSDYNEADKIEFLNNLAPADYEKIVEFIQNMPALYYQTTYVCQQCQYEHNIFLTGLLDFLG